MKAMEVCFDNALDPKYDYLGEKYQRLAEVAFEELGIDINYEIDVSLVDDETIHEINRTYRKIDRVTDVISFAFNDDKDELIVYEPDMERMLGEIFISIPQAERQAAEIGNSFEREYCFLFIHGLLHLLGYDHMKKEDEEIMFPLQEKILEEGISLWTKTN